MDGRRPRLAAGGVTGLPLPAARGLLVTAVLVSLALAGCGEAGQGPPEIEWGEDTCDRCHMAISDPRFAAAYRTAGGGVYKFDDVGDMISHLQENPGLKPVELYVRAYAEDRWLKADESVYVVVDASSPMGFNLGAFPDASQARAAFPGAAVLSWHQLPEFVDRQMQHMMEHL